MSEVVKALASALKTLMHPRMLALILWPMLIALLLWGSAGWFFWDDWVSSASSLVARTEVDEWLQRWELNAVASTLVILLVLSLLMPLVLVTALLIAALFAMPLMVRHVATRDFPDLEARRGGTFIGSVWNAFAAVLVFGVLWVITLPLWLFGPLAVLIPVTLSAYLNQRLFRYDALSEHASKQEFEQILERAGSRLYILGALVGLLHYVPLLNLFSPIYTGLVFIQFCLGELRKLRGELALAVAPAVLKISRS